jgi:hypothetical protein
VKLSGPLEAKAVAGPTVTLVAGYLSSVLISAVPWLHAHLTADQQQNLPIVIAFILSFVAAYRAPHTNRPDLPVEPSDPLAPLPSRPQVSPWPQPLPPMPAPPASPPPPPPPPAPPSPAGASPPAVTSGGGDS